MSTGMYPEPDAHIARSGGVLAEVRGGNAASGTRNLTREICTRLVIACTGRSYSRIGSDTGFHPETVRRYLRGTRPCVDFVRAIAGCYDVSLDWLIFGEGPAQRGEARRAYLRSASLDELLGALAERKSVDESKANKTAKKASEKWANGENRGRGR